MHEHNKIQEQLPPCLGFVWSVAARKAINVTCEAGGLNSVCFMIACMLSWSLTNSTPSGVIQEGQRIL